MRKSQKNQFDYHKLENRLVLAGNVHVLVHDSILLVGGDAQNNQVQISQNEAGHYVVGGTDTTINGRTESLVIDDFVNHVTIALNDGDDRADISGVAVRSNFSFYGGDGNDILTTTDLTAYHLHLEGNSGDDTFAVDFQTDKSAYLYLGDGNNVVSSTRMVAGRNLKIFGDSGNDSILLSAESSVRRKTQFQTGDGDDFVGILPNQNGGKVNFRRAATVDVGNGNNNIALDSGVDIGRQLRTRGGDGSNSFQPGGASFGGSDPVGFHSGPIDNLNDLIDEVFIRLRDSGIGDQEPFVPLDATADDTTLNFLENSDPVAVTPNFELTGSGTVTSAVIRVQDFAAGQESLSFSDLGNISGDFDASSGTMTLTGSGSTASYQTAIRAVQFENQSDNPITSSRTFEMSVTTNNETVSVSRNFLVVASDDAPTLLPGTENQTFQSDELPGLIDDQLIVTDPDEANITSAEVHIEAGFVPGEDILSSVDSVGIASSYDAALGRLLLTGDASLLDWQTVLRTVAYSNQSADPTEGLRTIQITLNGPLTASAQYQINLQAASQPNEFTVSQSATSDTVIGQVETNVDFETPKLYQFENNQIPAALHLNANDHLHGDPRSSIVLIEYLDFL